MPTTNTERSLLITYTIFLSVWPTTKTERADTPWQDLVERVQTAPDFPDKSHCPLISLCEFGDLLSASEKQPVLRHAANVRRVFGAEFDYDGELMAIEKAAELLQTAGIRAILYTSPSYTAQKPRWRALLPFAEPAAPDKRAEYLGRANRILGGVASRESFTLSQSFYIGHVVGTDYRVVETTGSCVDECGHIEPQYYSGYKANGHGVRDETSDTDLRAAFARGEGRYEAMLKLSSRWAARGLGVDDIESNLLEMLGPNAKNGDGIDLCERVRGIAESAVKKFGETRRKSNGVVVDHPTKSRRSESEAVAHEILPLEAYIDEQRRELVAAIPELDMQPPSESDSVTVRDFYAFMPAHTYIFIHTSELWPASSVNTRCEMPLGPDGQPATRKVPKKAKGGAITFEDEPMPPAMWLDKFHPVEQMAWIPGEKLVVRDRLINGGGWIDRKGCSCFNLYREPVELKGGEPDGAEPWREHLQFLFGRDNAAHITKWLAHRIQHPGEKINHALVLGGNQGIGKDSILEPIKYAVGPWNFVEISPTHLLGRFNGFVKSVILRVNEARDLGEIDRFAFYDHTKIYTAAPPDVIRCDEKNLREHSVLNVCGVIITSNHKQDGIYLPADDRRHYVAWSDLKKEEFDAEYWNALWKFYRKDNGIAHVAAYLSALDISDFDPKAPPPKTEAFWEIVNANRSTEDAEIADVIEILDKPPALTLAMLESRAEDDVFKAWLTDRKNRRQIPHRLESVGYVPIRNPSADDGLWKVRGKRKAIYANRDLSLQNRIAAATEVSNGAFWVRGEWQRPT